MRTCVQAAAKSSKPGDKDESAHRDRDGDDANGPSQGAQLPAAAAGGSTPGVAAASGSGQGSRGTPTGTPSQGSGSDRRPQHRQAAHCR